MRMTRLLLVPLVLLVLVASAQARSVGQVTAADDVRNLGKAVELNHPAPFRAVSKQRFQSEVDALARRAPQLSRDELLVGVLRIVALLGPRNGHSGLFPGDSTHTRQLHLYPLRLYTFADGVFVVDAVDDSLTRSRLVAIAGVPVDRVFELVEPLVPRDNEWNLRGLAPHFALTAEVLDGLGIVDGSSSATFTLERPGGERTDVKLTALEAPRYVAAFADPVHGHYPSILPRAPRPLYLAGSAKPIWSRALVGGKAVYLGYNAVRAPTSAELRRLERLVRGKAVRRVVVDVRLNGGGDNTTYGPFLQLFGSKSVNRRGRLYLLTGRATFSAAANFAAEIDRDTKAIIVGEPTGGGVETYGDTFPQVMTTLGWTVRIATEYHERKSGPNDRRLAVDPDVRVDLLSAQYFAGVDPVLARALRGL